MLWSLLRAELGASSLRSEAGDLDDEEDLDPEEDTAGFAATEAASTRVYNFLVLPWHFEKLCFFGFAICLDCFLYLFTLLPLKGLQQLRVQLFETAWRRRRRRQRHDGPRPVTSENNTPSSATARPQPQPSATTTSTSTTTRPAIPSSTTITSPDSPPTLEPLASSSSSPARRAKLSAADRRRRELDLRQRRLWRFSRLVVLAAGTVALCFVDMSRVYHYIRGQSVLKLYVIFNMLQICDRMFASFGEDILEALYMGGRRGYSWLLHMAAACVYVFLHGLLLFCQVITLNVSVNSNSNSIFIVLVSNNFVELKQGVFKRFKEANLFQVTCADIVERFQLFLFLVVVMIQNLSHVGLVEAADWLSFAGSVFVSVLGSEILVDWVKHGFITKFNRMPPAVYQLFHELLCLDFCNSYQTAASRLLLRPPLDSPRGRTAASQPPPGPPPMPHYSTISRRFGFSSFPLVCLFLRAVALAFAGSSGSLHLKLGLVASCWLVCVLLKLLLSVWLLGHSAAFPGSLAQDFASLAPVSCSPRGSTDGNKQSSSWPSSPASDISATFSLRPGLGPGQIRIKTETFEADSGPLDSNPWPPPSSPPPPVVLMKRGDAATEPGEGKEELRQTGDGPNDTLDPDDGGDKNSDDNVLRHRLVRFSSDASAQEMVRIAAYNLHARGGVSIDFSSKRESFFLKEPVDRFSMQGNNIY